MSEGAGNIGWSARADVVQQELANIHGKMANLRRVDVVNDRSLITTPTVVPLKTSTIRTNSTILRSTDSPHRRLIVRTGWKRTYPIHRRTLPIVSLLVPITTVHLRVSTTDERRIWHLVGARRLNGGRSVLRWRSTIGGRPRLSRQTRGPGRVRVAWVVRVGAVLVVRITRVVRIARIVRVARGIRAARIVRAAGGRSRGAVHSRVRDHLNAQRNLSCGIAQGRKDDDERANDGGDG